MACTLNGPTFTWSTMARPFSFVLADRASLANPLPAEITMLAPATVLPLASFTVTASVPWGNSFTFAVFVAPGETSVPDVIPTPCVPWWRAVTTNGPRGRKASA